MENKKKRQVIKISIILGILLLIVGVSYALVTLTLEGTRKQIITAGILSLELDEDENNLTIENAMPMYDEVGMIQEDVFTFRLINNSSMSSDYRVRLVDITATDADKLDTNIVKYGLTKDEREPDIKMISELVDGIIDSGTIAGNKTIEYELRLWIDWNVEDETIVSGKTLSYRIDVEATQETLESLSTLAFNEENLGENCKTYDDGVDTFLLGQCLNNYVWYSGKLWRIVIKNNETNTVKMMTDNALVSIGYNLASNVAFENSYVDQWLMQEFLPTLHNYEDYLVVDSVWDATPDASDTLTRPAGTTTVTRTAGLLNAYEYYTIFANSDSLSENKTNYLNIGMYWWLLTPSSSTNVHYVNQDGGISNHVVTSGNGLRPVINLKSEIKSSSGTGSIGNPYLLEGDIQKANNGTTLLSTRYSGEYITFNNELYRIVNIENGLTKIVSIDIPSSLSNISFHNATEVTSFASARIKNTLENYYQNLDETAKNMIEPNTIWYLGMVDPGSGYKSSICAIVDANVSTSECEKTAILTTANVALPRFGEIFSSHITRNTKDYFWLLTNATTSNVRRVGVTGNASYSSPIETYNARPSMYLKSNVVIANNNTGNGTYEKPYSIELGA